MLPSGAHTLEHDARGNKPEEDATANVKQDDREATTLALAETFTVDAVVGAGGESPNSEEKEMDGPTSAASPALDDSEGAAEKEQGDNDKDQAVIAPSVEGGQTTSSGRPQSPVTQAVESSFRKMAQGVTGSIDAASASLKESLGEVHQHLLRDFGDTERQMVEQLERAQAEYSRKTCVWLRRQQYAGLDQAHVEGFEFGRAEVDEKCREIVAKAFQDRCTAIDQRVTGMIDEIKDAFDGYLDDTTASAKQQLRWIKRQYREKIDINRAASRIELGDTLLLDRCILEEKVQQMDRRHEEGIARLQVEFQLERSDLRKAKRELEQSVQVLQLGQARAEQDAAQAHRSIESLEEEIYAIRTSKHSEDGSVKSHGSAKSYGSAKSHRKLVRGRSGTNLRGAGGLSPRPSARGASPLMTSRNGSHGGVGGGQGPRQTSKTRSSFMKSRASVSSRGGITQEQNAGLSDANNARTVNNASEAKHASASGGGIAGSPERGPSRGPTSARYRGRGGSTALGGFHDQQSAGGAGALDSLRSPRGGEGEGGQDVEHMGGWGGVNAWQDTHTSPAARHEEALHMIEQDVASKLARVIELKKLANLKEELDDEILNRQAAQARVALIEQAMAKLQGDLKKTKEQLVQARMETNELRKITHVLTADARQAEIYQKQEEQSTRVSSAAALLAGNGVSGDGSTGSGGGSASVATGSRNTTVASLRGSTGNKAGQMRLYRPNPGRATPDREWQEWAVHQPAEYQDSEGESISQIEDPEEERDAALEEMPTLRGNAKQRGRVLDKEEGKPAFDRPSSPSAILVERLEITALKESRRELEAKVARMKAAADENGYLRRRLEAIERTALKLNFGGVNNDLKILRDRLDVESGEVLRLRKRMDSLQAEKLAMSEVAAKLSDESVPLVKLTAERAAFEKQMAEQARRYEEEISRLELELTRLTDVKAEFQKLAETDFQESDSDGCADGGDSSGAEGSGGGRNGKWKQRVKKLQKYVQWQTAEAETQARRDRAENELSSRSHEMLMGEMAVLVRGYRHEQTRLYEVNRALAQRLEELESKPLSPTTHSPSSLVGGGGTDYLRGDTKTAALTTLNKAGQRKKRQRSHGDAQQWVAAMPAVLAATPVAFVPVHTLDKTPTFPGSSLPRVPTETASSSDLARAVSSENISSKNSIDSVRPRTSTGCERRTKSATPPNTREAKGVQGSRKREKSATRRAVEDVAWQLRSRLRDEYFGPLSHLPGARERAKYMSAVTARHTTRHPMVLSKPLSPVTGSVMTNVPLRGKAVDENIPRPDNKGKSGVTSRSVRAKRVEDSGGSSMHRGELW